MGHYKRRISQCQKTILKGGFIKSLNNRDKGQSSIYLLSLLGVEILASHP